MLRCGALRCAALWSGLVGSVARMVWSALSQGQLFGAEQPSMCLHHMPGARWLAAGPRQCSPSCLLCLCTLQRELATRLQSEVSALRQQTEAGGLAALRTRAMAGFYSWLQCAVSWMAAG